MRSGHIAKYRINLGDNSILFEDLWFIETPPPMGGSMGEWVGSGKMTNFIMQVIDIIQFCLKTFQIIKIK